MPRPVAIAERERILVEKAISACRPNKDGSYRVDDVINAIAGQLPLPDPQTQRHRNAKNIYKRGKQHDSSNQDGQLTLGLIICPYEPDRLIEDGVGNVTKESNATAAFLLADLAETQEQGRKIQRWIQVKEAKLAHYNKWAAKQIKKGTPALSLTWDDCIKETGIWKPLPKVEDEAA